MSVPNFGPGLPDPDPNGLYTHDNAWKGNPAPLYHDDRPTDEVEAASTRASAVTHRFGGVRYALSRPTRTTDDGGESDPQD